MLYFNQNVIRLKYISLLVLITLLASCSTIQSPNKRDGGLNIEGDAKKKVFDEGENNIQNELNNEKVESNKLLDPMANIQINTEIKKAYKQTANFIKRKQYPKALNLMIKIKGKYPQLSGPNYQMARIYLLQKQFDKSIEQVDASIKKNPRNYYSMSLKGVILKNQGKFDEAKLSYLKAIETFPNYSKSHLNLGVLADVYLGDLSLALSEYNIYMRLTSNKDKKVANWVLEVERRLKASK
ncbi:MAG: hypothetical protein COB38_05545 [Gammaproteobacteria bacterium]|nr:MAG: hypothetical protein COB38_05545 [Gammaproteobacteria bacterium]